MTTHTTATATASGGIGFTGLLTILFIALKLTGIIHWSWFWVLLPILLSIGLGVLFIVGLFILYMVVGRHG
jgi:hypothetical protein